MRIVDGILFVLLMFERKCMDGLWFIGTMLSGVRYAEKLAISDQAAA